MAILMWGWIRQKVAFKFRPTVWKKRYMVLTTMSIHIHKNEKGVISSLFPDNLPTVHVWSDFQSVKSHSSRCGKSTNIFSIEPRDPKLYTLKFKCVNSEEKEKWTQVIDEQLNLSSQIWSYNTSTIAKQQPFINYAIEKPIMSVSVLDKWLDQLQIIDTASLIKQQNRQSKGSINNRPNSTSDISINSFKIGKKIYRNSQSYSIRKNSLQSTSHHHGGDYSITTAKRPNQIISSCQYSYY